MRWRVDKVEEIAWLLLKPVMKTKNRRQNRNNKCIKTKEVGEVGGKGEGGRGMGEGGGMFPPP
jgi:hypothetical protein